MDVERKSTELIEATRDDGEFQVFTISPGDGKELLYAVPVENRTRRNAHCAPYIEVHSRLVAWWLIYAWRSNQLVDSVWSLGDSHKLIPAAACARALLETAAALWYDAHTLQRLWKQIKKSTSDTEPGRDYSHILSVWLYEVCWGSKFDQRSPDLAETWGRLKRVNVLTQVEKLAKATDESVQSDYQWLCNVVHPSVGSTLAFASPQVIHVTRTHSFAHYSASPSGLVDADGVWWERRVKDSLARTAVRSVEVITETLDYSLRLIDDIGLTTGGPQLANFSYWRKITPGKPNQRCPCRSGKKSKKCRHDWKTDPPTLAERFNLSI